MNVRIGLAALLFVACGATPPEPKPPTTTKAEAPPTAPAGASPDRASSSAPTSDASAKPTSTSTPAAEPPVTSVRVYVSNECDKPVNYCVEDGSTLNTSLAQRTSTTHTVKPGARIREKTGSSCGSATFTVPASKEEVKFSVCKK